MAVLNDGCCVGCRKEPRAEDAKLTCANCGNVACVKCAEWTCNASCNAAFLASEYNKIKERVEAARRDAAVSSDEEDNDESEDEAESVAEKKQKEKLEALRAKLVQNSVSHQTLREENTRLVVLAEQSTKAVEALASQGKKLKDDIDRLQQQASEQEAARTLKKREKRKTSQKADKKEQYRLRSLHLDLSVVTWLCTILPTGGAALPFGKGLAGEESSHPLVSFGFTLSNRGASYSNLLKRFKNNILSASERLRLDEWDLIAYEGDSDTPTAQLFGGLREQLAKSVPDYATTESKTTINTRLLKVIDYMTSVRVCARGCPHPGHCTR